LVKRLRSAFGVSAAAEVSMEANPDTVDEATLAALRGAGVTRLSMGAQSFDKDVLEALERVHQPEAVRSAYSAARTAGFDDVNLDLIFGAEGESLTSWLDTLEQAIELEPEHLSAYALTIEAATPLGRKVASGITPAPDPDLQADMYAAACERLAAAGYEHYEVSNWAKPGRECRHNLTYWRRGSYLGLGADAHSHRDARRWWNLRPPEQYLAEVEAGRLPVGGKEHLSAPEMRLEDVFLRLRMLEGIPANQVDEQRASSLRDAGLLTRRGPNYVLTERGMFLANEVILDMAR
ncbi:MAG: radical SAM family heme chaperone HemW, partial [Actinomycetota bacterium]